jgi:spermidine synthase
LSQRLNGVLVPLFAFLSGVPALIYQVVWTREVALLGGGQIEAISIVLVAFFGGLALGANHFGRLADRVASPLRLFGFLEMLAGLLAVVSTIALRALPALALDSTSLLLLSAAIVFPVTFLLGGTLPSLLCVVVQTPSAIANIAGRIVGANTAGAVLGVVAAVATIPVLGLRVSILGAAATAICVGSIAALWGAKAGATPDRPKDPDSAEAPQPIEGNSSPLAVDDLAPQIPRWMVLVAAALAGAGTLGYEVVATRLAALALGSSLYAWGLVLGLFLAGLAAGNLVLARRAQHSAKPEALLGWIEVILACSLAVGLLTLHPFRATPVPGLSVSVMGSVIAAVLPAAFCMGGAFPVFVRLATWSSQPGTSLGRVSAVNTAGGIAGALIAPFVLLPMLGSVGSTWVLAILNASIGLFFLIRSGADGRPRRLAFTAVFLAAGMVVGGVPKGDFGPPWVLYIADGRQATAVVVSTDGGRSLIVDGDPEAATVGDARRTEEFLATLPLLLHPDPKSYLEVGLGSGITLGTAHRFPLDRIECVEIAQSVISAVRLFEPDNRGVGAPGGAHIVNQDARVLMAQRPGSYDVISANTLHPWSIGATGLYSLEYFTRVADALRPGGIAVQWLPVEQIGPDSFELILRTFFEAFPHGDLWWGAGNVVLMGSRSPIPQPETQEMEARLSAAGLNWKRLGMTDVHSLYGRRLASAETVRAALGSEPILRDDKPVLEYQAAQPRLKNHQTRLYALLVEVARNGMQENPQAGAALLWLEALEARSAGKTKRADSRESLAVAAGFNEAQRVRANRLVAGANYSLGAGKIEAAERAYREALEVDPRNRNARFGLAGLEMSRSAIDRAIQELRNLLEQYPEDPQALNELASALYQRGDVDAARQRIDQALLENPYYPEALANAGLMALQSGDTARSTAMLARMRALSPLGASKPEEALAAALSEAGEN